MKATIKFQGGAISIPAKYVNQQTCSTTIFDEIPDEMVDREVLIMAHSKGVVKEWFQMRNGLYNVTIATDLIKWEE